MTSTASCIRPLPLPPHDRPLLRYGAYRALTSVGFTPCRWDKAVKRGGLGANGAKFVNRLGLQRLERQRRPTNVLGVDVTRGREVMVGRRSCNRRCKPAVAGNGRTTMRRVHQTRRLSHPTSKSRAEQYWAHPLSSFPYASAVGHLPASAPPKSWAWCVPPAAQGVGPIDFGGTAADGRSDRRRRRRERRKGVRQRLFVTRQTVSSQSDSLRAMTEAKRRNVRCHVVRVMRSMTYRQRRVLTRRRSERIGSPVWAISAAERPVACCA